jgi:hypothetical protein
MVSAKMRNFSSAATLSEQGSTLNIFSALAYFSTKKKMVYGGWEKGKKLKTTLNFVIL